MKPGERKVSTDALETLGTIIGDGEKRDATLTSIWEDVR